jgi:hypothetical protein
MNDIKSLRFQLGNRVWGLVLGLDESSADGNQFRSLLSVRLADILHILNKRQFVELGRLSLGSRYGH